jgi:hypothetical protein
LLKSEGRDSKEERGRGGQERRGGAKQYEGEVIFELGRAAGTTGPARKILDTPEGNRASRK